MECLRYVDSAKVVAGVGPSSILGIRFRGDRRTRAGFQAPGLQASGSQCTE